MRVKSTLLCGVCVGALALMPGLAMAQSASDADKVDQLQRQMDQLQQQMRVLKGEITQAKKKSVDQDSLQNAYGADAGVRSRSPIVKATPMERVKITLGGFFASETVYRTRNLVADDGTNFTGIPYPNSPQFNESEYHGDARPTRITFSQKAISTPDRSSPATSRPTLWARA
jgi:type II secretory pathway pseudopilin PulG